MATKTTTTKAKKPAGGKAKQSCKGAECLAPAMQLNSEAAKRAKKRYRAKDNIAGYETVPVYKKPYQDIFAEERAKGNAKKDTGKPAAKKSTKESGTAKPTRKQVLTQIIAEVAKAGSSTAKAVRLYVENRISKKAFDDAIKEGIALYKKQKK